MTHNLLFLQARVQLQRKQYDTTEAILTAVLQEEPTYPEALLQLSLLYAHTNRSTEALNIASSAAKSCTYPLSVCAHLLAHKADLLRAGHSTDAAQKVEPPIVRTMRSVS